MEHACRDSGSVHPQRCTNVTVTYRVTVGITIDVAIDVTVTVTIPVIVRVAFSVDVESDITISNRIEFHDAFRFTITDIR